MVSADIANDRTHCYLADGFYEPWLAGIHRLRDELAPATTLYPGHGDPAGLEVLDWQERYIQTMLGAVRTADWADPQAARASVIATMRTWLPSDQLAFLMELSVQPLAQRLGVAA